MKILILKDYQEFQNNSCAITKNSIQFTSWTCLQIVYLWEIIHRNGNNPQVAENEKITYIFKKQGLAC